MPRVSPVQLPIGLVRAAQYIHEHGGPEDVFQDSQFDRTYTVAARLYTPLGALCEVV